ncbi:type II toxin-antitoxin system VapB family antitoxin [Iodidimonas sp. SYSU 1G8]|uniref:type II toxin-antitoxin system VapB family antitoxin n=1 Tax=Iodidimonas sp. SYSU 1G8 TaxID=3133967 RepID=UPI0031FEA04C
MALNIKDDEIHHMAQELAALRGGTLTDAVRAALKRELDVARRAREARHGVLLDELNEIAQRCAALPDVLDAPPTTADRPGSDHSWLYDENGLPV